MSVIAWLCKFDCARLSLHQLFSEFLFAPSFQVSDFFKLKLKVEFRTTPK